MSVTHPTATHPRPWHERLRAWILWQAQPPRRGLVLFGCLGLLIIGSWCCCAGTLFSVVIARPPLLPIAPSGNPTLVTPWPTPGLLPTATSTPSGN